MNLQMKMLGFWNTGWRVLLENLIALTEMSDIWVMYDVWLYINLQFHPPYFIISIIWFYRWNYWVLTARKLFFPTRKLGWMDSFFVVMTIWCCMVVYYHYIAPLMDVVILQNQWNIGLILLNELVMDLVVNWLVSTWKLDCFD